VEDVAEYFVVVEEVLVVEEEVVVEKELLLRRRLYSSSVRIRSCTAYLPLLLPDRAHFHIKLIQPTDGSETKHYNVGIWLCTGLFFSPN